MCARDKGYGPCSLTATPVRRDHVEHGAVHEIADGVLGHGAIAHDFVGAAVIGDDTVEDTRMR